MDPGSYLAACHEPGDLFTRGHQENTALSVSRCRLIAHAYREVHQGNGMAVVNQYPRDAGWTEGYPVQGIEIPDRQDLVLPDPILYAAEGSEEQLSHMVQV